MSNTLLNVQTGSVFAPFKKFRGFFLPDPIMYNTALSSSARLTYAALCRYAGKKTHCWPALDTLAGQIGVSRRQMCNIIDTLVDAKYIRKEARPGKSTRYWMLWHESFNQPARQSKKSPAAPPAKSPKKIGDETDCTPTHEADCTRRESFEKESIKRPAPPVRPPRPQSPPARPIPPSAGSLNKEKNPETEPLQALFAVAEEINRLNCLNPKRFNPVQCIYAFLKEKYHPGAILEALIAVKRNWPTDRPPWGVANKTVQAQNGHYHARDEERASRQMKEDLKNIPDSVRKLIQPLIACF